MKIKGKYSKCKCKFCRKSFFANNSEIKQGQAKYCSQKCYHSAPILTETRKRLSEGVRLAIFEGRRNGVHLSGDKHPMWIADRNKVKIGDRSLNDPLQKQWRRNVKNRDGWKCFINDENCEGRLEAHHILSWKQHPELRYEINNGITLCRYHHPRKDAEVVRLAPDFQKMVSNLLAN